MGEAPVVSTYRCEPQTGLDTGGLTEVLAAPVPICVFRAVNAQLTRWRAVGSIPCLLASGPDVLRG